MQKLPTPEITLPSTKLSTGDYTKSPQLYHLNINKIPD